MGKHALVVEDDANTAAALCRVLGTLGFTTASAPTLKEAKASIAQNAPEVVLLDLSLPDGNGLEFMLEMKDSMDARFVVITGDITQEAAVESLRAEADDFLVKPVSLAQLRDTISRAMEGKNVAVKNQPDSLPGAESEARAEARSEATDESEVINALVGKTFWSMEKDLLYATLEHHNGDKAAAAKTLGISLKTFYNRLHAYS